MNIAGMNRNPADLIMTLEEAVAWRKKLQEQQLDLVITNGCFDLLHRGHAEYMMRARALGDAMLVLINSDASVQKLKGSSRPVIDEYSRAYMLCALESVDAVVTFNTPRCDDLFRALRPDIYVKGGDYDINSIDKDEKQALLDAGADIKFLPFIDGFSTSDIISKIKAED
ncbi:adenylyltransferase/cytidyltransferase family protein [Lentisphaerota bacterium ZTH]|nr:adenylyltransferase/cytidyltransferase family protein [Lentisphaerota bacterium]WET05143.1 adenylyltransferase/cytidyltransferase family protein [Lentisphaerota bacterium ZTH]